MIMKIIAIVEKGRDEYYSIRSEKKIGRYYFGGFGSSVEAAKADFRESVDESMSEAKDEGIAVPKRIDILFKYDIPSFFNCFDYLNVSKFAEFAGINESKMRAYKSGSAFPGEQTTKKIMAAINRISREISAAIL